MLHARAVVDLGDPRGVLSLSGDVAQRVRDDELRAGRGLLAARAVVRVDDHERPAGVAVEAARELRPGLAFLDDVIGDVRDLQAKTHLDRRAALDGEAVLGDQDALAARISVVSLGDGGQGLAFAHDVEVAPIRASPGREGAGHHQQDARQDRRALHGASS